MWTISELTELVGLSRRDIQRLCYADERNGGLGLLDPEDSTQGRRHFSREDVEVLFVVSQYKALGMSLPEAAEAVRRAQGGGVGLPLKDVADRLRREKEAVEARLSVVEAMARAASASTWDEMVGGMTGGLLERAAAKASREVAHAMLETLCEENEVDAESEQQMTDAFDAQLEELLETGGAGGGAPLPDNFEALMRAFVSVDWRRDPPPVRYMTMAMEALIDAACDGRDPRIGEKQARAFVGTWVVTTAFALLEQEGVPLVLEMGFGPGFCKALEQAAGEMATAMVTSGGEE